MSRHLSRWVVLAVVTFWLGAVVVDAAQKRIDPDFDPAAAHWAVFFVKRGCLSVFWMAATLLALLVYGERPLPLETRAARWRSAGHALLVALVGAHVYGATLGLVLLVATTRIASWWAGVVVAWPGDFIYGFFMVWQIIIAVTAYHTYRRMLRRKQESEALRARLQHTELMLFRAQLEPHFLFNTLNSIAALVQLRRADDATDALNRLATLLRGVLEVGQRQVMPWRWESDFARTYVALQKLRFADRLEVRFDAPDVPLPILLLQPLLENAILHGPLAEGRRCDISVCLRPAAQRLRLEVENEISEQPAGHTHGVGLANIGARLRALYGEQVVFAHGREGDRFVVRVEFPLETEAAA
jgi:two-component system, LytTR family, sensor kinase